MMCDVLLAALMATLHFTATQLRNPGGLEAGLTAISPLLSTAYTDMSSANMDNFVQATWACR